MRLAFFLTTVSFTTVLLAAMAPLGHAFAEPYRPDADHRVLERLGPIENAKGLRKLRQLRAALGSHPNDLDRAVDFAHGALELAQASSDPRFYGYAEAALARWLALPQAPPEALMIRASVRQSRHRFAAALEDFDRVIQQRPRQAQAWFGRAVVLSVVGEFEAALASCRPLARLAEPLLLASCTAHVAGRSGQAEASYRLLSGTLEQGLEVPVASRRWALLTLAEIAHRLGRPQVAEAHFREALSLPGRQVYALSAWADFLLDRGRFREVVEGLRGEEDSDPLLLRLTLAEKQLGAVDLAAHIVALRDRFAAAEEGLHAAAEARFTLDLLNDPGTALRLALDNWRRQREPGDARLVLAAALAAGDPKAARPVLEWWKECGLEDQALTDLLARLGEPS